MAFEPPPSVLVFRQARTSTITYYTTVPSDSILTEPRPGLIFVFIHDWAGSATEFRPLLAELANRRPHDRFVAISTPPDGTQKKENNARPATLISGIAELAIGVCYELAGQTVYDYRGAVPSFVFVGHGHGCRIALEMMRENSTYDNPLRIFGLVMLDGASHTVQPKLALLERWPKQRAFDGPSDKSPLGNANFSSTKEPRRTMMLNAVATVKPTVSREFLIDYLRRISSVKEPYATDSLRRLGIWDREEYPKLARNIAKGEYGADLQVRVFGSAETSYDKAVRLCGNETNAFQDYWLGTFYLHEQMDRFGIFTFQNLSHWAHIDDAAAVADALAPFARFLLPGEPVEAAKPPDPDELLEFTEPADIENAKQVVANRDRERHARVTISQDVEGGAEDNGTNDVENNATAAGDMGLGDHSKHDVDSRAEVNVKGENGLEDVNADTAPVTVFGQTT